MSLFIHGFRCPEYQIELEMMVRNYQSPIDGQLVTRYVLPDTVGNLPRCAECPNQLLCVGGERPWFVWMRAGGTVRGMGRWSEEA
jgi:hypothetical protein